MNEGWMYALFGRMTLNDFPFHSPVATSGAALVVFGALAVVTLLTVTGRWGWLWREWLTTVDHKKIGIMYVILAFIMLSRGVVEGVMMRLQQAMGYDAGGYLPPEHFAELFTTHGSIMIFFMAMPFLTGIINFAMPLQIGARDVSFPLLNAISFWVTAAGGALVMISLVYGKFSTGGWSGYPPYTGKEFSPGVGVDYWIWAITLSSIGSTLSGLNFAVTIYKNRAPGMNLYSMPLFTWTVLAISILMIFAMPPLTVGTALLALDRYMDMHFFTNDLGGNMMMYANLFWLFGHPEVYILILPAFGVYSEVIPTFSAKRLYGYTSLIWATMVIAVLSFTVWVHHFFTMGQSANINAAFGTATMLIGIPTGVKIYDWIWTMFRGRVRFSVPMIYSLGFIMLFVIGGLSGIILANPTIDYQVHNSLFLVAHFHNVLIPGLLFGMLAATHYWFPKAFGFRLNENWGRISAVCWIVGFMLAFLPLYVLGVLGMPRRSSAYFSAEYIPYTLVAMVGAAILLTALATLAIQFVVSIRQRDRTTVPLGDPWDGRSLEWSIPAPAPHYNFAVLPQVLGRDDFWEKKQKGTAYDSPDEYKDIEMPKNSSAGFLLGVCGGVVAFALVWYVWWLAVFGLLAAIGVTIARSFVTDRHYVIPAAQLREENERFLKEVRRAPKCNRDHEAETANFGVAEAAPA